MNAETKITRVFCSQTPILKCIELFTLTGLLGVHFISTWPFGSFPWKEYLQTCSLTHMWREDRIPYSVSKVSSITCWLGNNCFIPPTNNFYWKPLCFFVFFSQAFIPKSMEISSCWECEIFCGGERVVRGNRPSGSTVVSCHKLATGLRQDTDLC